MGGQHEETHYLRIVFGHDVTHGEKVSGRLAHFLIINIQECIMHPVSGERLAVSRFRLGNLIFMMREYQILSARMDVNFITQIFFAHDGAFNVPAGTAVAPGGFPIGLSVFFRLPEDEIQGIFLLIFTGNQQRALASFQIVQVFMGKLAVFLKASHTEIHGSVSGRIGMAVFYQLPDHLQHSADFLGSLGMSGRRLHIEGFHILPAFRYITFGNDCGIHTFLYGLFNNFIIHIGKVAHIIYFIAFMLKITAHRIKYNHGTGIAYMD